MYFVIRGTVEILDDSNSFVVATLTDGLWHDLH